MSTTFTGLTATTTPATTDVMAIDTAGPATKKLTLANLWALFLTLASTFSNVLTFSTAGRIVMKKAVDINPGWIEFQDGSGVTVGYFYNSSGEGASFFGPGKGLTIMSDTNPGYSQCHIDGGKGMTLSDVNNSNFAFTKTDSGFFTFNRELYLSAEANGLPWVTFAMSGYGSISAISCGQDGGGAYTYFDLGGFPLVIASGPIKLTNCPTSDPGDGQTVWCDTSDGNTLKLSINPG